MQHFAPPRPPPPPTPNPENIPKKVAPPDLTPAMLTDPVVAAGSVRINSHFFDYSVIVWWTDPIINILN